MVRTRTVCNKIVSFLLLVLFELNLGYSASYSGTSYSGKQSIPVTYAGTPIEPFEYEGELLYPISYCGSVINGVYYEGIDLTNYKITVLTITGKETDSDIFNDTVSAEYRVNWKKVLSKYAVGTTVIVITGVVSLCAGTIPLATAGYIAAGAFNGAITGSVIGGAIDAFISGTLAFIKGEPKEQIFKEAIEASADGFMWGAITGAIAGGFKSAKELSKGIPVLNSKGKIQYVVDSSTNKVYLAKGSKPVGTPCQKYKNGEFSFYITEKGETYDFNGIKRNIDWRGVLENQGKGTDGYIRENGKIIGLLDYRDGLIAQGKEMDVVIKDCWKQFLTCDFKEGKYIGLELGKKGDGQILKSNFYKFYGIKKIRYAEAHHIVPTLNDVSGGFGDKLREIFKKFKIDINDPHNCVLLPDDELRCKTLNIMKHKAITDSSFEWNTVHGNDTKMLEALYEQMLRCNSKEQVFKVLAKFRQEMMTNTPSWLL